MALSFALVRDVYKYRITQPLKSLYPHKPIDLREVTEVLIHNMLVLEFGNVTIETIRNEHRRIVKPCISRRSTQQDPLIRPCDLIECLHPRPRPHKTLLIEDKERISDICILLDVVPAVYVNLTHPLRPL